MARAAGGGRRGIIQAKGAWCLCSKGTEFKRELKKLGCYPIGGGKHEHWYNPKTGAIAPVSRHDSEELKKGTEMKIRKMLGI